MGDTQYMHAALIPVMLVGGVFGWVFRRGRGAYLDLLSARARIRGARRVFRREAVWTAGGIVVAVLVVRALMI
jgi:hypothetical protein